uniref:Gilatoxin-like n=1 Tax=Pogona vitticeps TaxID=103695 RepID=A0A6J0V3S0_9SAUR
MGLTRLRTFFLLLTLSFVSAGRNRIIGGEVCSESEHPWLVLLYDANGPYCSGILLNNNWVITAAHCYIRGEIQLRFGVHNRENPRGDEQLRVGADIVCCPDNNCCSNPSYTVECPRDSECTKADDDIMLIQLNSSVVYNDYIRPIALPTEPAPVGTTCKVMGWGSITTPEETYPHVPYCVDIEILNDAVCEAAYPWWEGSCHTFCAGVLEGGKDSCRGDSGGPLICDGELQGIVSFGGFPCAEPLEPGIYAKVFSYNAWIQNVTGGSS